jgi:acyl-CoA reductase-like NAD-dependent aldehyde dehydrogenase
MIATESASRPAVKIEKPQASWPVVFRALRSLAPEAFTDDGIVLNLFEGDWKERGNGKHYLSPIDRRLLGLIPMLDLAAARRAIQFASSESDSWARTDLDERKLRVTETVRVLREHREMLAHLLMWEIGKPFAQATVDVDRCLQGVEWYVTKIEEMIAGRKPLGLISNIASWNYPFSVLVHLILVELLAGNSVISKTPTDGGLYALTAAMAIARRSGLPVSLVSGSGGELSEALVKNSQVTCLAFVGGKSNGRDIAANLFDQGKRYMLEMEGINAIGVWKFSDWASLAPQIKKGFDYGKQRCTAYPRYVVQRELFPQFVEIYLGVLKSLRFGNPLLVDHADDPLPALDFGPLINDKKIEELRVVYSEALGQGAVSLYESPLEQGVFLPNQDISTYIGPRAMLNVPKNCRLYHNEPFGPIDTLVVADTMEEMIAEMNVSNGCLVSSIFSDDVATAGKAAHELRAFKVGVNTLRSRGDRDEPFGGVGQSWKGSFVGGKYLVQAISNGPPGERLYGNFPDYTSLPPDR